MSIMRVGAHLPSVTQPSGHTQSPTDPAESTVDPRGAPRKAPLDRPLLDEDGRRQVP